MTVAEELAKKHRAISVAEFFEKNRHLLGFDTKQKAMLTCVKEAVDNAIDACEEYNYINIKKGKPIEWPEVTIWVKKAERALAVMEDEENEFFELVKRGGKFQVIYKGKPVRASKVNKDSKEYKIEGRKVLIRENNRLEVFVNGNKKKLVEKVMKYRISVLDNGPGIVREQIPKIFGKMLYGSKFHRLKQARGQQGIGIHAAVLYAQLTTGMPAKIISKTGRGKKAIGMEIMINITENEPEVISEWEEKSFPYEHGTKIELVIEGKYISKGEKSIYEYIRRTSIINPHVTLIFYDPDGNKFVFKRKVNTFPKEPKEIKPHPHGLELGILMRMLRNTKKKNLKQFLTTELSRVTPRVADEIIKRLGLEGKKPNELTRVEIESLLKALHKSDIKRPPTDCLSPIGANSLKESLSKELKPDFVTAVTRKPEVYRGMPFEIEAAIAYGGEIKNTEVMRFANRIPLQYDASSCAITKAIQSIDWKRYGVENVSGSGIPQGPFVILVHIVSVWVPYTSEGKTAIASYPIILKEIRLALQECARSLNRFLSGRKREAEERKRINLFESYIPILAEDLSEILNENEKGIEEKLKKILQKGEKFEKESSSK